MSDFKPRQVLPATFVPGLRERIEEDVAEHDGVSEEPPAEREGLPATYRMRHDGHYVDHLLRRAAPPIRMLRTSEIHGPRRFGAQDIEPLAASIARFGLLQPLLVRRHAGRYELIDGNRRLAAAVAAGLAEVPCLVHNADDSRTVALHQATDVRGGHDIRTDVRQAALSGATLAELTSHLEAISACLKLLPDSDRPLRERVAKDLIHLEVQRAARFAQALGVLADEPALTRRPVDPRRLLEHVVETMAPERTLSHHRVVIDAPPGLPFVTGDEPLLAIAVAGLLAAVHAFVEHVSGVAVYGSLAADHARGTVRLRVCQDAVTLPVSRMARLFDANWPERPGGNRAAVGVLAARRIAELHGGNLEASSGDGRSGLTMELPAESRD